MPLQAYNSWKQPWKPLSAAVNAGLKRSTQAGGKQEKFKRARAYAEAAADAVLVHSKSPTFGELKGFRRSVGQPLPTYASITLWDLAFAGFKLAIFANQTTQVLGRTWKHAGIAVPRTTRSSFAQGYIRACKGHWR
jgi:2-methylisocitrate lyase-like PEP mutase family enzyme